VRNCAQPVPATMRSASSRLKFLDIGCGSKFAHSLVSKSLSPWPDIVSAAARIPARNASVQQPRLKIAFSVSYLVAAGAGGGDTLKVSILIFQVSPSRTLIADQ
jgi:hypothetical protein